MIVTNSPLTLLNKPNWSYLQDTVIQHESFSNYRLIEMDTTIGTKYIYVELHLFIDKTKALLERYERRAFLNGKSSQTIVYKFTDYQLQQGETELVHDLPLGYRSQMNSDRERFKILQTGQPAPDFSAVDIDGNNIDMESLVGRKILLNFSVINCGYCRLALEHFNRDGYRLSDEIAAIYINPEDGKSDVLGYRDKIKIPFPAIAEGKAIAKAYGVSGFPTFFLIDEQGVIEKVVVGYRDEFIESLMR